MKSLNAFDEYPIENVHSSLRDQTSEADSGELLRKKAKALDDGYNPNEHDEAGLAESTFQLHQQIFSRGFEGSQKAGKRFIQLLDEQCAAFNSLKIT